MKLPRHAEFNQELRLFVWRPRGIINEQVINELIRYLHDAEALAGAPFNRLSDACSADAIDLNFHYIFHVALFRRLSAMGRPAVKSAILVPSVARARYSKMIALLTQGSPLKVRIFEDRAQAAKWLGVPVAAITPTATDS